MKCKLEVGERMILSNILPKEGAYLTVLIAKRITKKLEITETEMVEWNIRATETSPGVVSYNWDPVKVKEAEFEFTDAETDMIRRELNKLDKDNKLNFSNLSAFEKFCNPNTTGGNT